MSHSRATARCVWFGSQSAGTRFDLAAPRLRFRSVGLAWGERTVGSSRGVITSSEGREDITTCVRAREVSRGVAATVAECRARLSRFVASSSVEVGQPFSAALLAAIRSRSAFLLRSFLSSDVADVAYMSRDKSDDRSASNPSAISRAVSKSTPLASISRMRPTITESPCAANRQSVVYAQPLASCDLGRWFGRSGCYSTRRPLTFRRLPRFFNPLVTLARRRSVGLHPPQPNEPSPCPEIPQPSPAREVSPGRQ